MLQHRFFTNRLCTSIALNARATVFGRAVPQSAARCEGDTCWLQRGAKANASHILYLLYILYNLYRITCLHRNRHKTIQNQETPILTVSSRKHLNIYISCNINEEQNQGDTWTLQSKKWSMLMVKTSVWLECTLGHEPGYWLIFHDLSSRPEVQRI